MKKAITVKELKQQLEILISLGCEDYTVEFMDEHGMEYPLEQGLWNTNSKEQIIVLA